ncbi:MAG: hypothetical protein ACR2LY_05520 [Thermoleophilaceae bacterium]
MHILFNMQSPSLMRLFDSAVRELAERGHRVTLVHHHRADGRLASELAPVADRVPTVRARLKRHDRWAPIATLLRETRDYARYLDRRLEAGYLRERIDHLPRPLRVLRAVEGLGPRASRGLLGVGLALERAIPSSGEVEELIAAHRPDVVMLTPLVTRPDQTDVVKSARALGIPSVLAVASWDHLTTKGLIRAHPDRVLVWNETQAAEARELHLVPSERIRVTGAHPFDRWFGRAPSVPRDEFCARLGLDPERELVLWAGSAHNIVRAAEEHAFVSRWIAALRASPDPRVAGLGVLIRPHPTVNAAGWRELGPPAFDNVALWPSGQRSSTTSETRSDLFDSLHHSAAVVAINTTVMIEAAIVGRPVLTVQPEDFAETQAATLHFRYLLPDHGGFLISAEGLEEHVAQLGDALHAPEHTAAMRERFLRSFVRPHGEEVAASAVMADAIEATKPAPAPGPWVVLRSLALRAALWLPATALWLSSPETRSAAGKVMRRHTRRGRRAMRTGRRVAGRAVGARSAR